MLQRFIPGVPGVKADVAQQMVVETHQRLTLRTAGRPEAGETRETREKWRPECGVAGE